MKITPPGGTRPITIKAVNKEPVTITGVAAAGWTYDGTAHKGYTGTSRAGAYTGDLDVAYSTKDGTELPAAPKDAGEYTVAFSVPDGQDYVGSRELSFTVEQAEITVKAEDKTATAGAAMPELTWRVVSGLADGESLKTAPVPACTPDMSKAGTYPITISGGEAPDGGNYKAQLIYQNGTLTVNPAGGDPSTPVKVTGITLDRDALTLAAGGTGRLNAVVRPAGASDKRVLWSTSGPDIVSVDSEGNLTAHASGTAVITARTRDGGFTAACTVTVTEARYAVRYQANGGSGTMPDGSALGAFVLPECGFVPPEGQEFDCWAVGGVNGPRVSAGETYLFTADTEVYALWRTPETYRAVFLGGGGEGAEITMENLSPGAVIRLPENPFRREGHTFAGWGYGGAVYDAGAAFTMPDGNVTFTARWKAAASGGGARPSGGGSGGTVGTFSVTVESAEHGKVTSSRTRAGKGFTVTLTVKPDSGYALDALTVTDSRGDAIELTAQSGGKYAFTMPGRAVTVRAAFAPLPEGAGALCGGGEDCPSRRFRDLGGVGTWYHEAVDYVLRNGLMNGYSVGFFGPDNRLTRAQLVQILYNRAGKPAAAGGGGFTDVAADAWCAPAIAWAAERGIAGGYRNGTFGPDDAITREQLAVMLWRYAGSPAAGQELRFHDAGEIGAYAREAVTWAAGSGVMNGRAGGTLDPKGLATRAQTAQMLKNFLENG